MLGHFSWLSRPAFPESLLPSWIILMSALAGAGGDSYAEYSIIVWCPVSGYAELSGGLFRPSRGWRGWSCRSFFLS
jgi:hypothetical protein